MRGNFRARYVFAHRQWRLYANDLNPKGHFLFSAYETSPVLSVKLLALVAKFSSNRSGVGIKRWNRVRRAGRRGGRKERRKEREGGRSE